MDDVKLLERLQIDYKEKVNYSEVKEKVMQRLFEWKMKESQLELEYKIKNLTDIETAMLNILEDARELEENLQESGERMSAIVSSMGEGLLLIDRNYRIVLINSQAERLLGISLKEVVGQDVKKITDVYKGEIRVPEDQRPAARTIKTGETVSIDIDDDFYYQTPSGKKFPVTLVSTAFRGDGITGAVIVFRDITEEKKLNDVKVGFISTASHQLRTPLTAIRWYTEMLDSGDAGRLNKNQKKFLKEIHNGVLRLGDTLNMLLALARVEGGRVKIESNKINILDFTNAILKEMEPLIKVKSLKTKVESPADLPEVILDSSMLRQVITNLLSNSIRYTEKGDNIEVEIRKENNKIVYSIKDDGIGIPENQKSKIFSKFFRADNAVGKAPDGNGLGLTLVKNLVELWKGEIWFDSPAVWIKDEKKEKKGTIFYFTVPI